MPFIAACSCFNRRSALRPSTTNSNTACQEEEVPSAALRDRAGWQKAVVALANKNARILWAVMTKGDAFDARHVSVKPGAPTTTTPAVATATA